MVPDAIRHFQNFLHLKLLKVVVNIHELKNASVDTASAAATALLWPLHSESRAVQPKRVGSLCQVQGVVPQLSLAPSRVPATLHPLLTKWLFRRFSVLCQKKTGAGRGQPHSSY